jgi:hypothetical protein
LSEDKVTRQAYQKRQDEIMLYNKRISDYKRTAEQEKQRADEAEVTIANQAKLIAELRSQLDKK